MLPTAGLDLQPANRSPEEEDHFGVEGVHPDGFLPYFIDVIKPVALYAESSLKETPETRTTCLAELRDKLKDEENLLYRDDDAGLLKFLRARKFDVNRAFVLIKKYYSFLDTNRDFFDKVSAEFAEKFLKENIIALLPYRDRKGRALAVVRAGLWNPDDFPPEEVITGGIVSLMSTLEIPANQIMGYVVIVDLKNLTVKQVLSLFPKYTVFGVQGLQYLVPGRVTEMHIINFPEIFRILWNCLKPLISEKMRRRIIFHRKDGYESLHSAIPKAILPEDFEGDLGPIDNSHWCTSKSPVTMQEEYEKEISYGYRNFKKSRFADKYAFLQAAGASLLSRLKNYNGGNI